MNAQHHLLRVLAIQLQPERAIGSPRGRIADVERSATQRHQILISAQERCIRRVGNIGFSMRLERTDLALPSEVVLTEVTVDGSRVGPSGSSTVSARMLIPGNQECSLAENAAIAAGELGSLRYS